MKNISTIALLAALTFTTAALGATVTTNAGTTVNSTTNAATGNNNAGATGAATGAADAQVTANSSSVGVDVNASASASADTSASVSAPDASSLLSQSSMSGEDSSMSSMTSSEMSQECASLGGAGMTSTAIDAAALAAVQNVTVFSISDCTGLGDMAAIDGATAATLTANPSVTAAVANSGYAGQQVVGYAIDGTSLTVYVQQK